MKTEEILRDTFQSDNKDTEDLNGLAFTILHRIENEDAFEIELENGATIYATKKEIFTYKEDKSILFL